MPKLRKRKAKVATNRFSAGAVAAIGTPNGVGYIQLIARDSMLGELVRILPGVHKAMPNLDELAAMRERFFIYFPFTPAANRGLIRPKGTYPVPAGSEPPRMMRRVGGRDRTGKILNWRILDGTKERIVTELTAEERRLSLSEVWNDTLLAERIAGGWSPELDA